MPAYSIANIKSYIEVIEDFFQTTDSVANLQKLADLLLSRRLAEIPEEEPAEAAEVEESRGFIELAMRDEWLTEEPYLAGYYISYKSRAFEDVDLEEYRLITRMERIVTSSAEFLIRPDGYIIIQRVRDFPPDELLEDMRHIIERAVGRPVTEAAPVLSIDSNRLMNLIENELAELRAIRFSKLRPANPEPASTDEIIEAINLDSRTSRVESVEYSTGRRQGDLLRSRVVEAFRRYARAGYGSLSWFRGLLREHEESGPVEIGESRGQDLKISISLPTSVQKAHSKILRILRAITEAESED